MRHFVTVATILLAAVGAVTAQTQTPLTNHDVVKLSKAGMSEEFIDNVINQQGSQISSDVSSLIELRSAGVNERVLTTITARNPSQESLNSDSVVRLAGAGFSDSFILDLMKQRPSRYSLTTQRIVDLKGSGLSERVIEGMVDEQPGSVKAYSYAAGARTLAAGTEITVRTVESIDSQKVEPGREFRASLSTPIMVGNEELDPRNVDATIRLVEETDSGKFTGKAELKLELVSLRINGKDLAINSSTVTESSGSRGTRTAKSAAAVGALGAIIGAIAGGGKGAAIGAGAGAAAGGGAQVFMKGQRVYVPSETLLTFTTRDAVRLP